jgi:hypothetical protein
MSNGIVLSQSIRSSLLTLQSTAEMQTKVQERLAPGDWQEGQLTLAARFPRR